MGKKFLSFIMVLVMCFTLLPAKKIVTMANVWWSGEGTEKNPYQIKTAEDLKALADYVNAGYACENEYFKLMNDIDLSSACGKDIASWTPIGSIIPDENSENGIKCKPFNGIFDGNSCTIKNLYMSDYNNIINNIVNNNDNNVMLFQGLFGYVGFNGIVKNLTLEDSRINVFGAAGSVVGLNTGKIENCSNINIAACDMFDKKISEIINEKDYDELKYLDLYTSIYGSIAGGIACLNGGEIKNCNNNVSIGGDSASGGIVAINDSSFISSLIPDESELNFPEASIINCNNFGGVIDFISGGIAAANCENSIIECCNNVGKIIGYMSGGAVGANQKNALVINCINTGEVYRYTDDDWTICDDIIGYDENTEDFNDEDFQFENNSCKKNIECK